MDTYSMIDVGVYQGGTTEQFPSDVCTVINLANNDTQFPQPLCAYVWMPIPDGPFPGLAWLEVAVGFVTAARKAGWGVLIHCSAGVSRSGMVDVAYHMKLNNWGVDEALAYVRNKRPQTDPNPAFMDGLRQYETYLYNK